MRILQKRRGCRRKRGRKPVLKGWDEERQRDVVKKKRVQEKKREKASIGRVG